MWKSGIRRLFGIVFFIVSPEAQRVRSIIIVNRYNSCQTAASDTMYIENKLELYEMRLSGYSTHRLAS